jgi:hypothetical protein
MRDEEILRVTHRDVMLIRVREFRALNYSTFLFKSQLTTQVSCTVCGFLKTATRQVGWSEQQVTGIIQFCPEVMKVILVVAIVLRKSSYSLFKRCY